MRRIVWSREARRDIDEIEIHWWSERPDYVIAVIDTAGISAQTLAERRGLGSPTNLTGIRKYRLGVTPFLMLYQVDDETLRIARIQHDRRNWRALR